MLIGTEYGTGFLPLIANVTVPVHVPANALSKGDAGITEVAQAKRRTPQMPKATLLKSLQPLELRVASRVATKQPKFFSISPTSAALF